MGLPELALKIIFCLLLAGLIGWIVGFLLGRIFGSANATQLLSDCEGRMRVREQELGGLRSDLTTAQAKHSSLETELATLATTLRTRDAWVIEMEEKTKDLQADLDARISELDELKAESDQAQAQLTKQLEQSLAGSKQELAALRLRVAEAEGALKSVRPDEGELTAFRANFAAQEQELAQALFRLKNLEPLGEEVKAREAEIARLQISLSALEPLRAQLAQRDEELTSLQTQLAAQMDDSQLQAQGAALAATSALLNDRDGEIARLRLRLSELEPLVTEVQQREARVRELGAQVQSHDAELAQWRVRMSEWEALSLQLQPRDARAKDAEIARLKVRLTELEMMVREVKEPVVKVSSASSMPPSTQERDDLKKIFGIGPVLEKLLNSYGIYWFRQIAEWSPEDVRRYDTLLEDFRGRIERDDWIHGAQQEQQKKYGDQI